MNERAEQLHAAADAQLAALADLISAADESLLRQPCPGREKLGDGTIGAVAAHTIENYGRIATFLATSGDRVPDEHANGAPSGHRIPRWLGKLGHRPPAHRPNMQDHDASYTADSATPNELAERLSAAREQLAVIVRFTDEQLDGVPPRDSFRFCDGQRTLEQVLEGLLKHQDHQVRTLSAALTPTP